jgi:hypothetical protein
MQRTIHDRNEKNIAGAAQYPGRDCQRQVPGLKMKKEL